MDYGKYLFIKNGPKLDSDNLKRIIRNAFKEDSLSADITSKTLIPKARPINVIILAKEECVVCGLEIARKIFKSSDPRIKFIAPIKEGKSVKANTIIAKISGDARGILRAERTALNFLALLSAVATKTRRYVNKVTPFKVKIADTRKTLPTLRDLEKYAVRIGGGFNHRFSLSDMILVKDTHLRILRGRIGKIKIPDNKKFEIEVGSLNEFKTALTIKPDLIMLDNMSIKQIKEAVKLKSALSKENCPLIEVSGGINLNNIRKIASLGVNIISVGDLTHSIKSIDLSLEVL